MSTQITDLELDTIKNGLHVLGDALDSIANKPVEISSIDIPAKSLSGDQIFGGKITKFQSTGIKDESTKLVVLVNNDGIITDSIDVDTLIGNTNVTGDLSVQGELYARALYVDELHTDSHTEQNTSITFKPDDVSDVYNKGLVWESNGIVRQLLLKAQPERIFSTHSIDIGNEQSYYVNGQPVLSQEELGTTVRSSSLDTVGTLRNLKTQGSLNFDNTIFYNPDTKNLGIGTDVARAPLTVSKNSHEFCVNPTLGEVTVGTWTSSTLTIVTDDTQRIKIASTGETEFGIKGADNAKVSIHGRLGIGINNVDAKYSLSTSGPVQMKGKMFDVGTEAPTTGTFNKGDIVWNQEPTTGGYVGWICTREGTPGTWKAFGLIS